METTVNKSHLRLVQGDITQQSTEAIVNAANSGLLGGGGVDGAIHRAGGPAILEECRRIRNERGPLPTGQAVATTAGNLKARYVIHTVGPVWQGGTGNEPALLASAYRESLKLAVSLGLHSVAFPSISTGAYGYPLHEAAEVALGTIISFLLTSSARIDVTLVLWDDSARHIYEETLKRMEAGSKQ